MPFTDRDKPITAKELTTICNPETEDAEYLDWKRKKIETALRQADEQPDNFLTQNEVWEKHGLGN
jgi:hypothetical protein